jgi:hypothetical protein
MPGRNPFRTTNGKTDSTVRSWRRPRPIFEWARVNSKLSICGIVVVAGGRRATLGACGQESQGQPGPCAAQNVQSGNAALAQSDLQALLRRYGGTTAAIQARLLLAQVTSGGEGRGWSKDWTIGSPGLYATSVRPEGGRTGAVGAGWAPPV